jgi:hypothetical protein
MALEISAPSYRTEKASFTVWTVNIAPMWSDDQFEYLTWLDAMLGTGPWTQLQKFANYCSALENEAAIQ